MRGYFRSDFTISGCRRSQLCSSKRAQRWPAFYASVRHLASEADVDRTADLKALMPAVQAASPAQSGGDCPDDVDQSAVRKQP